MTLYEQIISRPEVVAAKANRVTATDKLGRLNTECDARAAELEKVQDQIRVIEKEIIEAMANGDDVAKKQKDFRALQIKRDDIKYWGSKIENCIEAARTELITAEGNFKKSLHTAAKELVAPYEARTNKALQELFSAFDEWENEVQAVNAAELCTLSRYDNGPMLTCYDAVKALGQASHPRLNKIIRIINSDMSRSKYS